MKNLQLSSAQSQLKYKRNLLFPNFHVLNLNRKWFYLNRENHRSWEIPFDSSKFKQNLCRSKSSFNFRKIQNKRFCLIYARHLKFKYPNKHQWANYSLRMCACSHNKESSTFVVHSVSLCSVCTTWRLMWTRNQLFVYKNIIWKKKENVRYLYTLRAASTLLFSDIFSERHKSWAALSRFSVLFRSLKWKVGKAKTQYFLLKGKVKSYCHWSFLTNCEKKYQ